jgi:beta-N-acetylhexosaminidase
VAKNIISSWAKTTIVLLCILLFPSTIPSNPEPTFADIWLEQLTIEEKIGQLLMPRLAWQTKEITPQYADWLARYPVGGIILFSDNVTSIEQVQKLTADLQATQENLPLFIAVDEEGGRVSRVGRLFDSLIPPAFTIGSGGNPNAAYEAARTIGQRLVYLGFNMNFAPVADVWTNPANTVIGNRAFSRDPFVAGEMAAAAIYGLQKEGILSVVKHFPGHGDTYEDSHFRLAFSRIDRERFDAVEAIPFIQGIAAGTDGVMVGHISSPHLQNKEPILEWMGPWLESGSLPATFSDFWLQDVLRGEMGFNGLIITDALDMRALTDHFTVEQITVGAFLAGADILLMPTRPERAFYALLDAYHTGLITTERLHASLQRILNAKENL